MPKHEANSLARRDFLRIAGLTPIALFLGFQWPQSERRTIQLQQLRASEYPPFSLHAGGIPGADVPDKFKYLKPIAVKPLTPDQVNKLKENAQLPRLKDFIDNQVYYELWQNQNENTSSESINPFIVEDLNQLNKVLRTADSVNGISDLYNDTEEEIRRKLHLSINENVNGLASYKRTVRFYIAEEIFNEFSNFSSDIFGTNNLVEWLEAHIEALNSMILTSGIPHLTEMRIPIIVKQGLFDQVDVLAFKSENLDPSNASRSNFRDMRIRNDNGETYIPLSPFDDRNWIIDARQTGKYFPSIKDGVLIEYLASNGKTYKIDSKLLHELMHQWGLGDWYLESGETLLGETYGGPKHILAYPNDIMGNVNALNISAASYFWPIIFDKNSEQVDRTYRGTHTDGLPLFKNTRTGESEIPDLHFGNMWVRAQYKGNLISPQRACVISNIGERPLELNPNFAGQNSEGAVLIDGSLGRAVGNEELSDESGHLHIRYICEQYMLTNGKTALALIPRLLMNLAACYLGTEQDIYFDIDWRTHAPEKDQVYSYIMQGTPEDDSSIQYVISIRGTNLNYVVTNTLQSSIPAKKLDPRAWIFILN